MFGLLRPSDRGLRCSERQEFNRFYCGLCKGLDHHHGTVTRGLLSYDGVFVALMVDALVEQPAAPSKCRCPLLPVVQRRTVAPDSVAMTYAASVQMLLFDQWAADGGRSLVRRFSRPHAETAHARLEALGVSLRALEDFDRVQSRVESDDATPIRAAAPTAEALRLVFSRIASLPGARGDATTLGELGAAVGRAIYFVDALEDLDDDLRKGAFNPCILQGRRDERRVQETARLLRGNVDGLAPLFDVLPVARHERVLRDILGELRVRATQAIDGVRRAPDSRLRALVVAMAVFVWAMLCAVPRVFAAGPKRDAGIRDAGADASDASAGQSTSPWNISEIDSGLPELPPPESTSKPPPSGGPAPSGAPGSDPSKPSRGTGGGPCDACGNPCKGCCDTPLKCCDTCKGCCDAPTKCCDGCGNCCKSCDGCGKGCGDCGKCCDGCGSCCK